MMNLKAHISHLWLRAASLGQRAASAFRSGTAAITTAALTAAALTGCIKNDIPYPRIQPDFLSIEAEGMIGTAEIDTQSRFITMKFDETVDMENVVITSYKLSDMAYIAKGDLDHPINLEKYYIVTLAIYQDYDWVIKGVQNIERYFTVDNQVGASVIDVTGRRVVVTVPASQGLKQVKVLTMKLGPQGSVTTPALDGTTVDLTNPIEVKVTVHGREETWTIYGETVESTVSTTAADAWSEVAWVYGAAIEGRDNGVEYRQQGQEQWTKAPADWITHTGATFCARLTGLQPQTAYEARAYSGSETGATVKFTTGSVPQVPNSSLSEWSLSGKVWNPWPEGGTPYWDTGNKGATTLGDSNTTPTTDTSSGTGQAARLETRFVGIGIIGKLAAGNIFAGSYVRTDGTNGILSFGRPFTERPTRLHGHFKYNCATISHSNSEFTYLKGRPDTCIVWCALIDSDQPFEIRTNPANRHLFDPNGAEVVAYGAMQCGETVPDWITFDVNLSYTSTSRRPKYLLIVGSASKYGDYFTGGNGSVLYLDDLELIYDY